MKLYTKIFLGMFWWIWQLTWGALLTIPGLLITGFCILFLKGKPHKNGFSYIVEVGGNWGGLEIGAVSLCGRYSQKNGPCYSPSWFEHTRRHEFGHNVQQLIFGPLQLFVVGIPSICRYWYNILDKKHKKDRGSEWYDSIWFEGTATRWGTKWIEVIENGNADGIIKNMLNIIDAMINKNETIITETNRKETIKPEVKPVKPVEIIPDSSVVIHYDSSIS